MNVRTDVYLWIKFNVITQNSEVFSKMTIESFKSVFKNIYQHFHYICYYQLTEFF